MNIREITTQYKSGQLSPVVFIADCFFKIEEAKDKNYFVCLNTPAAMAAAKASEARYKAGKPLSEIDGIPYGLKDLIYTKEMPTTMGSAIYQDWIAGEDATCVKLLDAAGAINMGKLNLQEFAFGAAGDISYGGIAKNPYNDDVVCGGSSSGPAGAVAKKLISFSLSTDTGGSGRIPAALCGVVGIKPTYGRTSIKGIKPVCEELDHLGVMSNSAEDNALVLNILAKYDPEDMFSKNVPALADYAADIDKGLDGIKAGIPYNYFMNCCNSPILDATLFAVDKFEECGGLTKRVNFPANYDDYRPLHQKLLLGNMYKNHLDDIKDHYLEMGKGIYERMQGGDIPAYEYIEAKYKQEEFKRLNREIMKDVDVLIMPTVPATACAPLAETIDVNGIDGPVAPTYTHFTWFSNYTGFPCISIPMGFSNGLPIGLQIIGKEWEEDILYRIAAALEAQLNWEEHEWQRLSTSL